VKGRGGRDGHGRGGGREGRGGRGRGRGGNLYLGKYSYTEWQK
jgi:hypothetical protein